MGWSGRRRSHRGEHLLQSEGLAGRARRQKTGTGQLLESSLSPVRSLFEKIKKVIVYRKLKENDRRRGPRAWSSAAGCVPVALRLAEP